MTGILDPSRRGFLGMLLAVLAAFIGVAMAFGSMALAVHMIVAIPIVLVVARRAAEPEFGHRLMVVASWSVALWLARILLPAFTSSTLAVYAAMLPAIYASALFWWRALDCLIPASDAESAMPVRESALLRPEGIPGIQDLSFTPFPAAAAGKDEDAEPVAQAATDEPAAPEPLPWQGPKRRTCPSCWKTVEGDAAYCGSCGSPVAAAAMAAAPVAHAHAAPPVAPRARMTVTDVYAHHNRNPKPSTVVWDPALYRAPLGRRFLASVLDAIIAITLGFFISIVFGVGVSLLGDSAGANMELALGLGVLAGMLVLLLVTAGYFFTEALFGATVGKFLCGLRIAQADGQPGNIGFWFARYWFKNLPNTLFIVAALSQSGMIVTMAWVAFVLTVIGYLAVFGPSSQTFHDRASGTAVFMANDLQSGIADIVLARRLAGQLGGSKSPVLGKAYATMGVIIVLMVIGMRQSAPVWTAGTNQRAYASPAPAVSAQPPADDFMQQQYAAARVEAVQPVANNNAGQQVPVAGSGSELSQERIAKAWEHIRVFDAAVREVAQKVEHHEKMAHYSSIAADNHESMGDMHMEGLNAAAARREYLLAAEKGGVSVQHLDAAKAVLRRHSAVLAQSDEFLFRLGMDAESKGVNDLAVECYRRVARIDGGNAQAARGRLNAFGADW